MRKIISAILIYCFLLQTTSCVMVSTKVSEIDKAKIRSQENFRTDMPSRVHLKDGSMAVYESGFTVTADTIRTIGVKYDFLREKSEPVKAVALEDVAVIEKYSPQFHPGVFIFGTTGALWLYIVITIMTSPPMGQMDL